MKLTQEQFTDQVKNIFVESVQPLLDEHGKSMESIKGEIDEKISEAVGKLEPTPGVVVGDELAAKDEKGGFKAISQFAHDVYKTTVTGFRTISKELDAWEKITKASNATTLEEGEDQYGGFLIPPEFRNDLMLAVEQRNEILPRTTRVPIKGTTVKIPFVNGFDESGGLVYGGIEWKWLDELATKTPTRPAFGRITLDLKKMAGLAYASDEILEDSPMSMENILKNGFRDGLNYQVNKVLIRGTGAGQPLGILNAPCLVSITKETGQAASTIVFENIIKMYARISDPAASLVWIANPNTLPQLATMALSVGTGGAPVWLPANGAAGKPFDTLMGKPIIWNKHCATLGTVGDIALCDWSQYLVGMKSGQGSAGKFDVSIHLKFDSDQTCFRFVFRVDGQPWWPAALTPPQATNDTISPFVVVASRT